MVVFVGTTQRNHSNVGQCIRCCLFKLSEQNKIQLKYTVKEMKISSGEPSKYIQSVKDPLKMDGWTDGQPDE